MSEVAAIGTPPRRQPPSLSVAGSRPTTDLATRNLATTPALWAGAHLAAIDLSVVSLGEVTRRVAELAQALVPVAVDTCVVLVDHLRRYTVAFTGPLAAALDERQFGPACGPAIAAATSGWEIDIADTAADELYPDFSRQACRSGVRSVLSVAVPVMHGASGSLTLYGSNRFGKRDRDLATGFAAHAAATLSNALSYAASRDLAEQMRQAMASRAVIEQAKGMIMADRRCTADEAFAALREASTRSNRKLRDIAASLVEGARH